MYKSRIKRLEYAKNYRLKNKEKINLYWKNYYQRNREKELLDEKIYYQDNKIHVLKRSKKNYIRNKTIVCDRAIQWRKNNPFKASLSSVFTGIKGRCNNKNNISYKYYGKRGIRCYLNFKDIIYLWNRDNADKLKRPSIDRIDNDGNYEISNCRFIELSDNIRKRNDERRTLAQK